MRVRGTICACNPIFFKTVQVYNPIFFKVDNGRLESCINTGPGQECCAAQVRSLNLFGPTTI